MGYSSQAPGPRSGGALRDHIQGGTGRDEGQRRAAAAKPEVVAALPHSDERALVNALRLIVEELEGPGLPVQALWPTAR